MTCLKSRIQYFLILPKLDKLIAWMGGSDLIITKEQRFKTTFETFKRPIHDYIAAITASHDMAEELTQEVFVRIWKKIQCDEPIDQMDQYIFRIAHNLCMDYFKKARLDARLLNDLQRRMDADHHPVTDYLNYKDADSLIGQAIEALPPQRQKIYQLSRDHGLKLEEIAEELKLSRNTAKNHLVLALRQIREYYSRHHSEV